MTLLGDKQTLKEIDSQFDYQINRVFALEELIKKDWNSESDYEFIYRQLLEAKSEARRIDGLRNQILK